MLLAAAAAAGLSSSCVPVVRYEGGWSGQGLWRLPAVAAAAAAAAVGFAAAIAAAAAAAASPLWRR